MKKLELKHLAPYLPYGLKMTRNGFVGTLMSIMESGTITLSCSDWHESINDKNHYKPILHPLSEIDTEIIYEELGGKMSEAISEWMDYFDNDPANWDYAILTAPYPVIEWCFENHFDVYSLIPDGLAVDINTLNK